MNNRRKATEIQSRFATQAERDAAFTAAMEMATYKDRLCERRFNAFNKTLAEFEKLLNLIAAEK